MYPKETIDCMAMIGGKRGFRNGYPIYTNFCMSNPIARKKEVDYIIDYARRAIEHMNGMLEVLHGAENPKWPVFYKYESLSCYWHTRDLLRCVLSLLLCKGETPLRPFHNFGGHNKRIYYYDYLEENKGNFPFLKKH